MHTPRDILMVHIVYIMIICAAIFRYCIIWCPGILWGTGSKNALTSFWFWQDWILNLTSAYYYLFHWERQAWATVLAQAGECQSSFAWFICGRPMPELKMKRRLYFNRDIAVKQICVESTGTTVVFHYAHWGMMVQSSEYTWLLCSCGLCRL